MGNNCVYEFQTVSVKDGMHGIAFFYCVQYNDHVGIVQAMWSRQGERHYFTKNMYTRCGGGGSS